MPGQSNAMIQKCPRCASPVPPAATLDDACPNCGRFYKKTIAAHKSGTLIPPAPDFQKIARMQDAQKKKDERQAQIEAARGKAKKEITPAQAVLWTIGLSFLVLTASKCGHEEKPTTPIFSGWDGSHYDSVQVIKRALKDPKSFEHVSTTHTMLNGKLYVKTVYRARNSFGALVLNHAVTQCEETGEACTIVETEN